MWPFFFLVVSAEVNGHDSGPAPGDVTILGIRNMTMTTSIDYDCYRYSVCCRVCIVQSEIPRISNKSVKESKKQM